MTRHLWIAATGLLLCAGCSGGAEAPPFKPVADNALLMESVIDPAADVIWGSVGTIITAEGEQHIRPQNDEEWMKVRNAALTVAESGNLLMMVPRAKDGDEWMRLSQAMIDTATAAMRAAEAKSTDGVFDTGAEIYAVCTNCHVKYDPAISRVQ